MTTKPTDEERKTLFHERMYYIRKMRICKTQIQHIIRDLEIGTPSDRRYILPFAKEVDEFFLKLLDKQIKSKEVENGMD